VASDMRNDTNNDEEKNDDVKESNGKEKSIFVKVTEETRNIIDKYKEEGMTISNFIQNSIKMYDEYYSMAPEVHGIITKYKQEDESLISFLEKAIKFYGEQKSLDRDLWVRARDEMKMMLIGKTTFNQLIAAAESPEDARHKPQKKNVAFDLILWYTGKPLKNLSPAEIINTIQKMWVVANYFYAIDVKQEEDEFFLLFKHRQDRRFSEYWLGYFIRLFNSEELPFKSIVEGQAFDETISMTIKVAYEK
jgi:hypothetical protein